MVRGIEIILRGRDPRDAWAFAQRICGVCTLVHGMASIRASVEDALHRAIPSYSIPQNAELIRNLMIATQYVHDHVMHFYHLHALDWVDVVSALKADPKATSALAQSISSYPKSSPGYFADVQKKVKTFVEQGQLGIFANAYWGHPAYKLPPEANLMAVAHYLEALAWQRDVVKLHAIFGGKNPHPNFVVGGVPSAISVHTAAVRARAGAARTPRRSTWSGCRPCRTSSSRCGVRRSGLHARPAGHRLVLQGLGRHRRHRRQLPVLRRHAGKSIWDAGFLPDPARCHPGRRHQQDSSHQPGRGQRDPGIRQSLLVQVQRRRRQGPAPVQGRDRAQLHRSQAALRAPGRGQKYSWLKSPRWKGKPMEVGPLARVLMMYAKGNKQTKELVDFTLKTLDVPVTALFSTLGRTAARGLESKIIADAMQGMFDALMANIKAGDVRTFNDQYWDPSTWPKPCRAWA
jgi:hydrogenase large subunit